MEEGRIMTSKKRVAMMVALSMLAAGAAFAAVTQNNNPACTQVDAGTGTVSLPPAGCNYLSPNQVHQIIQGLPTGTTIILDPIHTDFICRKATATGGGGVGCEQPGGTLGGHTEQFGSTLVLRMTGTGVLAGWSQTISLPAQTETHTGPRQIGAPVQSFDTDMHRIEGTVQNVGDFEYLHISAGTANGYPSPGRTTLTRRPDGTWNVDSRFTIGYRIDFKGAPGSRLGEFGGSTEGTVDMQAGVSAPATDADTPVATKTQ